MEYLRVHGYPVPAVQELTDNQTNLIMERIQGPSMVDYLSRHPWMIRRQGTSWPRSHHQLHEGTSPLFSARRSGRGRVAHSSIWTCTRST